MDDALKKKLLERKFRSIEYMEQMRDYHQTAIDAMVAAIQYFYAHPPQNEDWHNWHRSDWPETWEERALVNFKGTQKGIEQGIDYARKGDLSYVEGAAGELHNIFRNLDYIGWKWWDYTDPELQERFYNNLVKARDIASNIWWTLGDYWEPGEIVNEEITGPMNEQDLLRYLKSGESP